MMDNTRGEEEILLLQHGSDENITNDDDDDDHFSIETKESPLQKVKNWFKKFCNSEFALIEESELTTWVFILTLKKLFTEPFFFWGF